MNKVDKKNQGNIQTKSGSLIWERNSRQETIQFSPKQIKDNSRDYERGERKNKTIIVKPTPTTKKLQFPKYVCTVPHMSPHSGLVHLFHAEWEDHTRLVGKYKNLISIVI